MALNRVSAVHRGVAFEQRSLQVLQSNLSMSLWKVGGKSDGGVDLQGWWWLPASQRRPDDAAASWPDTDGVRRRRIRVVGQCKAEKKKMGPNYVRELEGVLGRHHSQERRESVVGLLVSQSPFTRSTVLRAFSSPHPLFLLHLPPDLNEDTDQIGNEKDDGPGQLGSAVWNPALGSEQGLLSGEFEVRWEWSLYSGGGRPGLWWNGEKLSSWIPAQSSHEEPKSNQDLNMSARQ